MFRGNRPNGLIYLGNNGTEQNYFGHFRVFDPRILHFKLDLACEEEVDLTFLVKDPSDLRFRLLK